MTRLTIRSADPVTVAYPEPGTPVEHPKFGAGTFVAPHETVGGELTWIIQFSDQARLIVASFFPPVERTIEPRIHCMVWEEDLMAAPTKRGEVGLITNGEISFGWTYRGGALSDSGDLPAAVRDHYYIWNRDSANHLLHAATHDELVRLSNEALKNNDLYCARAYYAPDPGQPLYR